MKNKKLFSMILITLTLFLLSFYMMNSISIAADDKDERENSVRCPEPNDDNIRIYCTEGKSDCSPRDCPETPD